VDAAIDEVDQQDRREMCRKAEAANRAPDGDAKFDQRRGSNHEEEICRAVHGGLANIPDNAVTAREVLRVSHEHSRVFEGRDREINEAPREEERDQDKEEAEENVESQWAMSLEEIHVLIPHS
jgi:hypothetical protein